MLEPCPASAQEALSRRAAVEFDELERQACLALCALDSCLGMEFGWLPWAALGSGPGLGAARALRRAAWAKRLAHDLWGNVAWAPDGEDSMDKTRRCAQALGALAAPARIARLWGDARLELALAPKSGALSNLIGALSAGPGQGSSWRRLFGSLDALDVREGAEEGEACRALAELEGWELKAVLAGAQEGEPKRL